MLYMYKYVINIVHVNNINKGYSYIYILNLCINML